MLFMAMFTMPMAPDRSSKRVPRRYVQCCSRPSLSVMVPMDSAFFSDEIVSLLDETEPGDKFEIPRGTLHAERGVIEATTYIVGTEVAGKVFEQFAPLDADDPNRPK